LKAVVAQWRLVLLQKIRGKSEEDLKNQKDTKPLSQPRFQTRKPQNKILQLTNIINQLGKSTGAYLLNEK
jgi:hypothetical protein